MALGGSGTRRGKKGGMLKYQGRKEGVSPEDENGIKGRDFRRRSVG